MTLDDLNKLGDDAARVEFLKCCGSVRWAETMASRRPFSNMPLLLETGDLEWNRVSQADWKEAFGAHPRIGDVGALRKEFSSTSGWAEGEQSAVFSADEKVLLRLMTGNFLYRKRFGYLFIVCATGKSAGEMLALLEQRLKNDPQEEIMLAAREQQKITRLRLEKLLSEGG
jgi:2-oxo-4-hydroxy-4-carboxy-5-ureidoimidazoline decarboxylase